MTRAIAASLAALALLAAAPPVCADDVADAKARLRRGTELYRAGKWREAIAEFEAAYRLKPHGAIHFNVAQCRERLAEWPAALRAYDDYLREVPDARDRAAVRAAIARIEQRLAAAGVQALVIYSDPPGADVTLDGRLRGKTPFHIVLPPGSYALALALDGYDGVRQEIALAVDTSRVVDAVLRPTTAAAAPPPGAPAAPDLKVQPQKAASPAGAVGAKGPPPRPAEKRRVYTWIAAGTAVAAAAAGGYFGWSAQRDADAVDGIVNDGERARQTAHDARTKARTANVLYAASGAAAAAGLTLFFVEKRF